MKIRYQTKKLVETRLLMWFKKNKRVMPWRTQKSAYGTLVSEVMLQQTQIKTVIPYYKRWMKAFPTLEYFASAPIDRVLKLWEGLGYYSRARNLHKTAQIILNNFQGRIPHDVDTLISLPGIGRYTAGAIASIAFHVPAPIVDGNVARVLSRIFCIKKDIKKLATQHDLYDIAGQLVSTTHPGDFNQALMELGSLVCFPVLPQCRECPVRSLCKAYKNNCQESLPVKSNSLKRKTIHITTALIQSNGSILVRKRDPKGIWGGLWEMPNLVSSKPLEPGELKNKFEKRFYLILNEQARKGLSFVHKLTHVDTVIHHHRYEVVRKHAATPNHLVWADARKISELSFPVPFKKLLFND